MKEILEELMAVLCTSIVISVIPSVVIVCGIDLCADGFSFTPNHYGGVLMIITTLVALHILLDE